MRDVLPEHCANGHLYTLLWCLFWGGDVSLVPYDADYNLTNLHAVFRLQKSVIGQVYSFDALHVIFALYKKMFEKFLLHESCLPGDEGLSGSHSLLKAVSEPCLSGKQGKWEYCDK